MRLEASGLRFRYDNHSAWVVDGLDLSIEPGERVALVGNSGCGKSTIAKLLSGYLEPAEGYVSLGGKPLPRNTYCPVQLISQHPELAVNPRLSMKRTLSEAWMPDTATLARLGIEPAWLSRKPAELSGGELQRFCIARALSPDTRFLLCDEISTMLDVITQAQIWELVLDLAAQNELGLLVVTHNHALAQRVCERIIRI